MPTIPILNGKTVLTSDAPSFARDNLRRPTVDLRGVIQGVGAVGDEAGRVVEMSNQLAAPYGAIADLGKTIADAGGVVGALMVKRKEARDKSQTFDHELAMSNAAHELRDYQDLNPTDTEAWETRRQKVYQDLERRLASDQKLSPEAREALGQKLRLWDSETAAQTASRGTRADFQMAKSSTIAEMERASEAGDQASWQRAADEGVQNGWIYPHEKENSWQGFQRTQQIKAKEASAAAKKAWIEGKVAEGMVDAKGWLARNPKPAEGDDVDAWQAARSRIETAARDEDAYIASTVSGMILAGQITHPEEIEALAETTPGFTPDLVEDYKEVLRKHDGRKLEIDKQVNGDERFVEHWVRAEKVDFDAIADDKEKARLFNKLLTEAKLMLPDDKVGEITALLHQKYGSREQGQQSAGRPESRRLASKALQNSYTREEFGKLTRWDKDAKDGKGDWVPDPILERKAMTAMAQAEKQMSDFFKAYPDAPPEKVEAKVGEILRGHRSGKAAGTILIAPPTTRFPTGKVDWSRHLKGAPSVAPNPTQNPPFSAVDNEPPPGPPPPPVPKAKAVKDEPFAIEDEEGPPPLPRERTKKADDIGDLSELEPGGGLNTLLPDIGTNFKSAEKQR